MTTRDTEARACASLRATVRHAMNRCQHCHSRAYLADLHCQRCGTAIEPPPAVWLQRVGVAFRALIIVTAPFQVWHFLTETAPGRSAAAFAMRAGREAFAHADEIGGLLLALVVLPLVSFYVALRAMVDIGDWIELKVQQWRAERSRKYGW